MAIFVMLNNFFHDFAVALLFACLLVMTYVHKSIQRGDGAANLDFAFGLFRWLNRVIIGSWAFIIVGGVVRTLAYEQYEWMESAGRGQIAALIIKHILLVSFVIGGTMLQLRLRKFFRNHQAKAEITP